VRDERKGSRNCYWDVLNIGPRSRFLDVKAQPTGGGTTEKKETEVVPPVPLMKGKKSGIGRGMGRDTVKRSKVV